ncbi:MAG: hypothetical protein IT486_05540 [Gammaproteobacteria bacterium]|nr:hypothetical protein [Gammaproteobacteria bacterium]
MRQTCRNLVAAAVAGAVLAASPAALAAGYVDDRPTFAAMFADGLLVRPLGLGATVLGAATWLVTLPFSALGGNIDEATQKLVVEPAQFTFTRPLGEL